MAKAERNGITRIELEVRADNQPAIALYESMGFILEARKRNAMRFQGVYYETLLMARLSNNVA
jgi:putative acetyltransferase